MKSNLRLLSIASTNLNLLCSFSIAENYTFEGLLVALTIANNSKIHVFHTNLIDVKFIVGGRISKIFSPKSNF